MTQDSAADVLNLGHLAQYTGGDQALEKEILGMFLPSVRGYLDQMRQAAGVTEWQHAAHALKGVCRGVGAFALADAAERYEARFPAIDGERQTAIDDLSRQIEAVAAVIETRLGD